MGVRGLVVGIEKGLAAGKISGFKSSLVLKCKVSNSIRDRGKKLRINDVKKGKA